MMIAIDMILEHIVKLKAASASAARGNTKTANNQLHAFVNGVSAQTGKTISSQEAQTLTSLAQDLVQH